MPAPADVELLNSRLLHLEKALTDALHYSDASGMPGCDAEQLSSLTNILDRLRPLLWIYLNRESRPQPARRPPVPAETELQADKTAG